MPSTSSKGRFLLVSTLLVSATSFTVSSNNNLSATYKTTRTRRKTTKHSPPNTSTLLAHSNAGSAGACGGFPFTRRIHATKARLPFQRTTNILSLSTDANVCDSLPEPSSMRIKEIKDELKDKGISFSDCFDKDSLVERLNDARSGKVCKKETPNTAAAAPAAKQNSNSNTSAFDKDAAAAELRTKKVRELRTMCAQNDIRWGGMIEKEEIVQALVAYQEKASNFSPSGKITPGKVAMIDQDILAKEVAPGAATTPLLLDIYATWCGPVSTIYLCFFLQEINSTCVCLIY